MPPSIDLNTSPFPFDGAYWVLPGRLSAGCHPCFHASHNCREVLSMIINAGIQTFIDLTEPDEPVPGRMELADYSEKLHSTAHSQNIQIRHFRGGIVDHSVPSRAGMIQILDVMDASLKKGHPAYVHCMAGIGRTGTVVGCYLVRHGYVAGDQAMHYIADLRKNMGYSGIPSPETRQQQEMVHCWAKGE